MVAIFIIYDWKKNAILATPVKKYGRRNDSDLLQATDNIPLQKGDLNPSSTSSTMWRQNQYKRT